MYLYKHIAYIITNNVMFSKFNIFINLIFRNFYKKCYEKNLNFAYVYIFFPYIRKLFSFLSNIWFWRPHSSTESTLSRASTMKTHGGVGIWVRSWHTVCSSLLKCCVTPASRAQPHVTEAKLALSSCSLYFPERLVVLAILFIASICIETWVQILPTWLVD